MLRKSWALANDLFYMPSSMIKFQRDSLELSKNVTARNRVHPYTNPGRMVRIFNIAALGVIAVGSAVLISDASSSPVLGPIWQSDMPDVLKRIMTGASMIPIITAATAFSHAIQIVAMKALDSLLYPQYRGYPHEPGEYMLPRFNAPAKSPAPRQSPQA